MGCGMWGWRRYDHFADAGKMVHAEARRRTMKCDLCDIEPNDVLYCCEVLDGGDYKGVIICQSCLIEKLGNPTWVLMELYTTDPKSKGDADGA